MTASESATTDGGTAPPDPDDEGAITQEDIERVLERERPAGEEITLDETFDVLRNQRRRDVLVYLAGTEDNTATLGELAEHVAAKENDIERAQLSSAQRKRVYIGLYQCHLPKMDELDVIDYNQDRGTVVLREQPRLFSYLPDVENDTDRSRTTLSVALAVAAVVAVGLSGVGPVAVVPAAVWAVVAVAALVAVGLYHARPDEGFT